MVGIEDNYDAAHKAGGVILEGMNLPWYMTASITDHWSRSPIRVSAATKGQVAKWPELAPYLDALENNVTWYEKKPYIIWRLVNNTN